MMDLDLKKRIKAYDERRDIIIPGDQEQTIKFCVDHFIFEGNKSIAQHGYFAVALSGGSTPKAIYEKLALKPYRDQLDWSRVWLFWSDERCVPLDHPDSNYHMAMEAGFNDLPIPEENIFPMPVAGDVALLEQHAKDYEHLILKRIPEQNFDFMMLGMGEDGHTASLFPKTHALHSGKRLVVENYIPDKNVWRMTLTFDCINAARVIAVYVLGAAKAKMVHRIFVSSYQPDELPVQKVGTPERKALWILDKAAASELSTHI